MTAVSLGPLILSAPRFAAVVGLGAFLLAAHVVGRRQVRLADWAWTVTALVVLGARVGYVFENVGAYLRDPLSVLYVWQGGFSPFWGLALALLYTLSRAPVRRAALPLAVVGLAAWGGTHLLLTPAEPTTVARPEAPLNALDGNSTTLEAVSDGRPLVVNLWAPWCPPCRREMPMIVETADRHPEIAFALVDQGSSAAEVRAFLGERGLDGDHVFLDPRTRLGRELGTKGLPTTLVFEADGTLAYAHVGEISRAELERRFRRLP